MTYFSKQHEIIYQISAPYSPQSNEVVKRKNKTLLDMINIMLTSSSLPNNLLGEALYSTCHILYRVPNKSWKKKTLYEIWKNWTSNLKILEEKKAKIRSKCCRIYIYWIFFK